MQECFCAADISGLGAETCNSIVEQGATAGGLLGRVVDPAGALGERPLHLATARLVEA